MAIRRQHVDNGKTDTRDQKNCCGNKDYREFARFLFDRFVAKPVGRRVVAVVFVIFRCAEKASGKFVAVRLFDFLRI